MQALCLDAYSEAVWPILEQSATAGLKTELENSWLEANVLHEAKHAPALTTAIADGFQEKQCRRLGLCLCQPGPDADAYFLHQKIVMLYKNFFVAKRQKRTTDNHPQDAAAKSKRKPKKTASRLLLEDGFLVLRLRPMAVVDQEQQAIERAMRDPPGGPSDKGWSELASESMWVTPVPTKARAVRAPGPSRASHPRSSNEDPLAVDGSRGASAQDPLYFHVGFCNYTTYQFSVLRLMPGDVHEEGGRCLRDLNVPETPTFLRAPNAFKSCMDLDAKWAATWHVIFSNDASLAAWDTVANKVEIDEKSILPELVVWKAGKAGLGP